MVAALHVLEAVVLEVEAVAAAVVEVVRLLLIYDFAIFALVKQLFSRMDGNGVDLDQHFFQ